MTSRSLLICLECCAPQEKRKRDCSKCLFYGQTDCHNKLMNEMISYVTETRGKIERLNVEADKIISAVAVLRTL